MGSGMGYILSVSRSVLAELSSESSHELCIGRLRDDALSLGAEATYLSIIYVSFAISIREPTIFPR